MGSLLEEGQDCMSMPPAFNPNHVPIVPAVDIPQGTEVITNKRSTEASNLIPSVTTSTHPTNRGDTIPIIKNTLGRNPQGLQCPHCHRQTTTVTKDWIGIGTIIAMALIAIFVWWPLCWIPYCIPSCRKTVHYCGYIDCRKKLGETSVCA